MNSTRNFGRLAAFACAALLAGTAPLLAHADDVGQNSSARGYGMGPGMMSGNNTEAGSGSSSGFYGMGPGMMYGGNGGYGYGMGPGMMGAYGMGPGMMYGWGGYGMGPGMMGYGMGPGMMYGGGGYGMGMGMMGYGMGPGMMYGWGGGPGGFASGIGLNEAQQAKINTISDETRKSQWALMGAMLDQQAALRDQYVSPKHDEAAVAQSYKNFANLRQQMFDNMVSAQKRIDAVLTKEQREKLRGYWGRGW